MKPPRISDVNAGGFYFLREVYERELEIVKHSPENAMRRNLIQAQRVAGALLNALDIYKNDFPVQEINDPCQNMDKLPLQLTPGSPGWPRSALYSSVSVMVKSPSRRDPGTYKWLGSLDMSTGPERSPNINSVRLNRSNLNGAWKEVDLYTRPPDFGYGYPANVEAMNFIGIVDAYLKELGENRLKVVA